MSDIIYLDPLTKILILLMFTIGSITVIWEILKEILKLVLPEKIKINLFEDIRLKKEKEELLKWAMRIIENQNKYEKDSGDKSFLQE